MYLAAFKVRTKWHKAFFSVFPRYFGSEHVNVNPRLTAVHGPETEFSFVITSPRNVYAPAWMNYVLDAVRTAVDGTQPGTDQEVMVRFLKGQEAIGEQTARFWRLTAA